MNQIYTLPFLTKLKSIFTNQKKALPVFESHFSNNVKRTQWAEKYEAATGKATVDDKLDRHECAYCHRPVYYMKSSVRAIHPLNVFCCDEHEEEYRELGPW